MVLKVAGYLESERRSVLCRSEAKPLHHSKMLSVALEEIIAKAHPLEARICYHLFRASMPTMFPFKVPTVISPPPLSTIVLKYNRGEGSSVALMGSAMVYEGGGGWGCREFIRP